MDFGFLFRAVVKLFGLAGRTRPPIFDRFGPHFPPTVPTGPLVPHVEISDPVPDITPQPDPVPVPEPTPKPNGLRHDWRKAKAAWLYPGSKDYWIASHRMMKWTPEKIHDYLNHPEVKDMTHIIICASTGSRKAIYEKPFNALKNEDHVRQVFEQVIAADKAPILWCMSQEFFQQTLKSNHNKLLDHLKATVELVADLCHFAVPFRELGEIYGGRHMDKRNGIFKAMRAGSSTLPLAEHERGMVEIPVDDFKNVGGIVISGLQTSFKTPTGGFGRKKDLVTSPDGKHKYDGAAGFIKSNGIRMARYVRSGHIEAHVNAVFEHSLPLVYQGQSWLPTRSLKNARERGQVFLKNGAEFDLSSGATR